MSREVKNSPAFQNCQQLQNGNNWLKRLSNLALRLSVDEADNH